MYNIIPIQILLRIEITNPPLVNIILQDTLKKVPMNLNENDIISPPLGFPFKFTYVIHLIYTLFKL